MAEKKGMTRRELLKNSAMTMGALALAGPGTGFAWAKGSDTIRIGIIGCGQRGLDAVRDCLLSTSGVEVTALADILDKAVDRGRKALKVKKNGCIVGLNSGRELLSRDDVDLVVLATPPAFRPAEVAEAVAKGKHVFMEPPVAICPTGIMKVRDAAKAAGEKKLGLGADFPHRHNPACVETMKRIHDGAIGKIMSAQCYDNGGAVPALQRQSGESDMTYQLRNWRQFRWLSGDHVVSLQVQGFDLQNWAFNELPYQLQGLGGQQYHTTPEYGNVYDHFGIEFEYPGKVMTLSTLRKIAGTEERVGNRVVGTQGSSNCCGIIEGVNAWRYNGKTDAAPGQALAALIKSIRDGAPLNEGEQAADATLTAVMSRESAYSRRLFKRAWFVAKCDLNMLPPENLKLTDAPPMDPVAIPGKYELKGWPKSKKK